MKTKFFRLFMALALLAGVGRAAAQGTAFTYQGQLNSGGGAANGLYDFQFSLSNAPSGGGQVGGTLTKLAVGVTNGLFSAPLDFGAVFTGNALWLAISVRSNGTGSYTGLTPLQPLLPAPYAIFANTASNLSGTVASASVSGTYGNAVTLNNGANQFSGNFAGNGANVTSLNANNLSSGTVPLTRLSGLTSNQLDPATWQLATNLNGGNAALASNVVSGIAMTNTFATNAYITNSVFAGNGGGLTNLNAAQLSSGVIPLAQLPGAVVTNNNATSANLNGTFIGNGASLTSLNANNLSSGTVPLTRLSGLTSNQLDPATWQLATNLNGGNAALASNVVSGIAITNAFVTNAYLTNSVFAGNGGGLTNLNAAQLSSGVIPLAQLPVVVVTNNEAASVNLNGTFTGNGGALTNLNASQLSTGVVPLNVLPGFQSPNYATVGGGLGNIVSGSGSTVGGGFTNTAGGNYATIAGGVSNTTTADFASVGGGLNNLASGQKAAVGGGFFNNASTNYATISGGRNNTNSGSSATIGGGVTNTTSAHAATVAGGYLNTASGLYATVGGGGSNQATNSFATVPGGATNLAGGEFSFAAGQQAQATNQGAFVWADSQNAPFSSTANDQFLVRAQGGAQFVTGGAGMTLDGQPVLTVGSGSFGLSIQQNFDGAPNVIEDSQNNSVQSGVEGATIGGGGASSWINLTNVLDIIGNFFVLGYSRVNLTNNVSGAGSFGAVGGGGNNEVSGVFATIGGGYGNIASGPGSVVGGGGCGPLLYTDKTIGPLLSGNTASGAASVVSGGLNNVAANSYATVPGGVNNFAGGQFSFAAGQQAQAINQGAFVWADSQNALFTSTVNDQFLIRAQGGVGIGTASTVEGDLSINTNTYLFSHAVYLRGDNGVDHNHGLAYCGPGETNFAAGVLPDGPVLWGYGGGALGVVSNGSKAILVWSSSGVTVNGLAVSSDRNVKSGFAALNPQEILARVAALPVTSWVYTNDVSARHVGPMAQDFHAAFALNGSDDKHISVTDEGGVALAAIQGLNQKLDEKNAEIEKLKEKAGKVDALEKQLNELAAIVKSLAEKK